MTLAILEYRFDVERLYGANGNLRAALITIVRPWEDDCYVAVPWTLDGRETAMSVFLGEAMDETESQREVNLVAAKQIAEIGR